MRDIFILKEIKAQDKYFCRHFAWLKYFTYHLAPVLAQNYKQHTLSATKVRKICYLLDEFMLGLFI
jgi:hypothetical protein